MGFFDISFYISEFIDFVRWGYGRDKEVLPQINLLMLTSVKSHMPLYYRIIPGSIKDVNTLQDSLANLSFIEKATFHYVMDKGFYSGPNIDAFYASHKKFIIGIPFTVGFACDAVEEFLSGKRVKEHATYYEKFFFIKETPVRGHQGGVQRGNHL